MESFIGVFFVRPAEDSGTAGGRCPVRVATSSLASVKPGISCVPGGFVPRLKRRIIPQTELATKNRD